jgi:hypothetical protein
MKLLICLLIVFDFLVAQVVHTPFDNVEHVSIFGTVNAKSYEEKQKWLKLLQAQIVTYIKKNDFKKEMGEFYKKSAYITPSKINNNKNLLEKYTTLATNRFDLKEPTLKIMINYLDESFPDYHDLVAKRANGIDTIKKELIQKPHQVSQQFFIYKNSYSGFDITFTEYDNFLDIQEGGRIRIGIFDDNDTSYLFIEDKLSFKIWLEQTNTDTINELKNLLSKETIRFYNPEKTSNYTLLAKKQPIITSEQLVSTAVADDSDSSRVECDAQLTLNNENITIELDKIDKYIYKIAPYNDDFKLPEKTEGVVWSNFYWKYKKMSLLKKLAMLNENEKIFLQLLADFVKEEKHQLKKLLEQEELIKIDRLFQSYWTKHKIENMQIEDFLNSVDIVDLIALGMR